jgi:hypothetical protein
MAASYQIISLTCQELLGFARICMPLALAFVSVRLCGEEDLRLVYILR